MKLEDRVTPVEPIDFFKALCRCWLAEFGDRPSRESALVIMAHSALETGHWKYIHWYNIGNVKSQGVAGDWCFYECNEIYTPKQYYQLKANWPPGYKVREYGEGEKKRYEVWFYPDHPVARFRAHRVLDEYGQVDDRASLDLAMTEHLRILKNRFSRCWPRVLEGDPGKFVDALKTTGYFTAPPEPYRSTVVSVFGTYSKKMPEVDEVFDLTDDQRSKITLLVHQTTSQSITDQFREDMKGRE